MKYLLLVSFWCALSGCSDRERDEAATPRDSSSRPTAAVYKLEELTWNQIDALDRSRTLFILPLGMIEQHGPHLPVGSDTFGRRMVWRGS